MANNGQRFPNDGTFLNSFSFGDQQPFMNIPGRNADCAQSAAGNVSGRVRMGSIDPVSHIPQPLAPRSARDLDLSHQLTPLAISRYYRVPPNAQGICCFCRRLDNWHFGRFEAGGIVHADTAALETRGMGGGTFAVHPPALDGSISLATMTGQRGVTPGQVAADVADFVVYCGQRFGHDVNDVCYYYVYFG